MRRAAAAGIMCTVAWPKSYISQSWCRCSSRSLTTHESLPTRRCATAPVPDLRHFNDRWRPVTSTKFHGCQLVKTAPAVAPPGCARGIPGRSAGQFTGTRWRGWPAGVRAQIARMCTLKLATPDNQNLRHIAVMHTDDRQRLALGTST